MFRKIILVTALLATAISVPASAAARTRATEVSEVPIAMDFLAALGRLDFDAAASLLDEDAVLDLPYVNDGLIVRRQADILQFFRRSMSKSVSGIVYKLDQAYRSPMEARKPTTLFAGKPKKAVRPDGRGPGRPTAELIKKRNEELLDRALDLFLEQGFEATTIDLICAELSMSRRTIYARYGDKDTLFRAALQRAIDQWIVPIDQLRAEEVDDLAG